MSGHAWLEQRDALPLLSLPAGSQGVRVKELFRWVISSAPAMGMIRMVTLRSPMTHDRRRRVYLSVAKKVRPQPDRVFVHRAPGGDPCSSTSRVGSGSCTGWASSRWTRCRRSSSTPGGRGASSTSVRRRASTRLLAASVAPQAQVWAFEPGSAQMQRLTANIELNRPGPGDRVTAVDVALSDRAGEAQFHELPGGTSSLNPEFRSGTVARVVAVARGDDLLPDLVGESDGRSRQDRHRVDGTGGPRRHETYRPRGSPGGLL